MLFLCVAVSFVKGERTRDFAFVSLCYGRSGEDICTGYAMAASGRMQYDYKQTNKAKLNDLFLFTRSWVFYLEIHPLANQMLFGLDLQRGPLVLGIIIAWRVLLQLQIPVLEVMPCLLSTK